MAIQYPVKLAVTLRPIWHQDPPRIRLGVNDSLTEVEVQETITMNFEFVSTHVGKLSIEFLNKQDSDTIVELNLDKAVVIENISFFGISDPRFIWAGEYRPNYPELWASQQKNLQTVLKNHNYLGWNGKWTLTFDVPVFTWIHKIQNLGWIYT